LDLASLASVHRFVERWESKGRPLHILVNNAGIFSMGGEQDLNIFIFIVFDVPKFHFRLEHSNVGAQEGSPYASPRL
jgi:NAD(P)-dependent dehydrogenase (short-subunit alcohol dehydrogenase family)